MGVKKNLSALPPINERHAAGRTEHSGLIKTAVIVVVVIPAVAIFTILASIAATGWIVFRNGQFVSIGPLKSYLDVFSIDAGGLAGFIAFGGLLLAINRIEMKSQDGLDAEAAVRSFILLRFRNSIQWAAVIGASTAPAGGLLWVLLNTERSDWAKSSATVMVACLALWTVLLLALPSNGYFGLQSVAKEWTLDHAAFRQDSVVQSWGKRWNTEVQSRRKVRWYFWHLTWRWLIFALLASAGMFLLSWLTDTEKPDWNSPYAVSSILILFAFAAYVEGLILLAVGWLAVAGRTAANRGWRKTSIITKALALLLAPGIAAACSMLGYLPFTGMAWTIAVLQVAFVVGLLIDGELRHPAWWPVRGMVLSSRAQSHQLAYRTWRRLDRTIEVGLNELPRRERKRKEKEISRWRESVQNGEI